MIFYSVIIPVALLFLPWLVARFVFVTPATKTLAYKKHVLYLVAAAAAWLLALVLPNVPVSGQTDSFTMHFMGGVVAACLFVYAVKVYQLQFTYAWQVWIGLFLCVSALGVLNELFEFLLQWLGLLTNVDGDEWWDLLANTLGGFVSFALYFVARRFKV